MRNMKDSGIEWIGDIPETWKVIKVKNLYTNNKYIVGNKVNDYERLALTLKGVIKRSKDDSDGLQPQKFEGYQVLKENELVFKLIDLENINTSRVGLSPYTGIVSPAYIVLNNKNESRFGYYYFLSMWHREIFNKLGGSGVRSNLNSNDLLNLPYLCINHEDQELIADYLDDKVKEIDNIISKTQETIEEYKKYKQSVITEAVTKGLNPDTEKKDTGIEWIGEIPQNWDIIKLTNYLESIVDYRGKTPSKQIEGTFLVTAKNIKNGNIRYDLSKEYVLTSEYEEIMHRGKLKIGDVLFTTEAPLGEVANVDREDFALAQRIIKLRGKPKYINNYFLKYWFMSSGFQSYLSSIATGSTAKGIKSSRLYLFKMAMPPIIEQKDICNYLNKKCNQIDNLIVKKEELITQLEKYKKSLIYEYVTGKKEVAVSYDY